MNQSALVINGQITSVSDEWVFAPLAQFLRRDKELVGTKVVCAEGDCGACTVIVKDGEETYTVNSCIAPTFNFVGKEILTVEGLGHESNLHAVQQAMCDQQGTQCGYCTPGIVCSLAWSSQKLSVSQKIFTPQRVKNALTGNLCRCTGYDSIVQAGMKLNEASTAAKELPWSSKGIKSIKKLNRLHVAKNRSHFVPLTISDAVKYKSEVPQARIISGATDLGVVTNKGKLELIETLSLCEIEECKKIELVQKGDASEIRVGAAATLSQLEAWLEIHKFYPEFVRLLHVFASPQIKNAGTLIGNLMNGSPIGDTLPFLFVKDAVIELHSVRGAREISIHQLFKGYKSFNLDPDEVVTALRIPAQGDSSLRLYKVSLREDLDISAVTFAGQIKVVDSLIKDVKIAMGGLSAVVSRVTAIEGFLMGKTLPSLETGELASLLEKQFQPLSDVRGSKDFRMTVSCNLLVKYVNELKRIVQLGEVTR